MGAVVPRISDGFGVVILAFVPEPRRRVSPNAGTEAFRIIPARHFGDARDWRPSYSSIVNSETRYAVSGDLRVAYRTIGEGARDIVWVANWFTNCEVLPDLPVLKDWLDAMATLGRVIFFDQLTFRLPRLMEFLNTAENLRFSSATLIFQENKFSIWVYPNKEARMYALYMDVGCRHLDWQVASAAQIFRVLRSALSVVEDLTLEYWKYGVSSGWRNEAGRTQWRDLLRSFSNVKTLRLGDEFVRPISRLLQVDGESAMELLPELKVLEYPASYRDGAENPFNGFIDTRKNAGHPVTVQWSILDSA